MELINIIDENGNRTGEIMDKDEVHRRGLPHYEVAMFVINDKGQVLLQKRSEIKKHSPNKWTLCAGHVKAGEELEIASQRELEEKIGVNFPKEDIKFLILYQMKHITTM